MSDEVYFKPIDFARHMRICVQFREDSFRVSYPNGEEWRQHWDEADYRQWIVEHAANSPVVPSIYDARAKLSGNWNLPIKGTGGM